MRDRVAWAEWLVTLERRIAAAPAGAALTALDEERRYVLSVLALDACGPGTALLTAAADARRYQAWLQYLAGQCRGSARHWATLALYTPAGAEPAWPPTWKRTPAGWRRA